MVDIADDIRPRTIMCLSNHAAYYVISINRVTTHWNVARRILGIDKPKSPTHLSGTYHGIKSQRRMRNRASIKPDKTAHAITTFDATNTKSDVLDWAIAFIPPDQSATGTPRALDGVHLHIDVGKHASRKPNQSTDGKTSTFNFARSPINVFNMNTGGNDSDHTSNTIFLTMDLIHLPLDIGDFKGWRRIIVRS